jgi:hypothetical protein
MQPRAESRKSVRSVPPPHAHLVKRRYPLEDVPTTRFARVYVDVDDTVPVELYSQPYERVEIESTPHERVELQPDSRPYELFEIEQEIEFTETFDLAAPHEIAAEETDHIVAAPAPRIAVGLFFAMLLLGVLALGFCFAFLVF